MNAEEALTAQFAAMDALSLKRRISVFLVRKQMGNGCLTFIYTSVGRTANRCDSGLRLRVGCG